jgi:hypothetical protein
LLLVQRGTVAGEIAQIEKNIANAEAERAAARKRLAALDATIHLVDKRLNARAAGNIKAFKMEYGKRGALKEFIRALIESRPSGIGKAEIAHAVRNHFGLKFHSEIEYSTYVQQSINGTIASLKAAGIIENCAPSWSSGCAGLWRVRRGHPTFEDLRNSTALSIPSPDTNHASKNPAGHQMAHQ